MNVQTQTQTYWLATLSVLVSLSLSGSRVDAQELPTGLYSTDVSSLEELVNQSLPESNNVDANFLNPNYDPNLRFTEDASVSLSFISEGAGYRNSLGYFTFDTDLFAGVTKSDLDTDNSGVVSLDELSSFDGVSTDFVFQNASQQGSGGQLNAGDTLDLADGASFAAGTRMGFFLVQNGWTGSGVRTHQGSSEVQTFYTLDFLNPEAESQATTATDSATNTSRHAAMLFANDNIILGFEDLNRVNRSANAYRYTSDEDFNDAVFILNVSPFSAVSTTPIARAVSVPSPPSLFTVALGLFMTIAFRRRC